MYGNPEDLGHPQRHDWTRLEAAGRGSTSRATAAGRSDPYRQTTWQRGQGQGGPKLWENHGIPWEKHGISWENHRN